MKTGADGLHHVAGSGLTARASAAAPRVVAHKWNSTLTAKRRQLQRMLGSAPSGLLELVNKKYPVWPLGSSGTSRANDEKPNSITWRHLTCEVWQHLRLYR